MGIKIREKKLNDGRKSIYLDIYHNGKRHYEFLKLYLVKATTAIDRESNKETRQLAQNIKAKRQIELQSADYQFTPAFKKKTSFITFAQKVIDSKSSQPAYLNVLNKITEFGGDNLTFEHLTEHWCQEFYKFLNKNLANNTAYDYCIKASHFCNQALREKIIVKNNFEFIQKNKRVDTNRNFLTFEELQILFKTPCSHVELKKAFLFSALTGLRWSDLNALKWGDIKHTDKLGYFISHQQIKTKSYETLSISDQAINILGKKGRSEQKVLKINNITNYNNMQLRNCMLKAGIDKHITFHSARHTFATLQLTYGTDIKTVSKLLGHKDVQVTQIYAKIIDSKKVEAVNKIPKL
ncbi:MAG: site-specific integrase [Cytophagales bacterium]|nr:site-specific integrase [Cytophagales bacterium]